MKLRIRGDSLRLRLTQGEVLSLAHVGHADETTSFGDARLVYAIRLVELPPGKTLAARLGTTRDESRVEIHVGVEAGRAWANGDEVGIEGVDGALRLLVEKDYACLKARPHEDDADAFPNPNRTC